MTELEKCMAGQFYDCHDKVFLEMKAVATQWMQRYNSLPYEQRAERYSMLKELFGHVGENCSAGDGFICGFGRNIYLGTRVRDNDIQLGDITVRHELSGGRSDRLIVCVSLHTCR